MPSDAPVVAADSGADLALALGLRVDELIGDLDSVAPPSIDAVTAAGGTVERHPAAKDHTDLELSLQHAVALGPDRILVLGGHGGRDDHHLATGRCWPPTVVGIGRGRRGPARPASRSSGPGPRSQGRRGRCSLLLAVGGPAGPVRTEGLVYPLRDEVLDPGLHPGHQQRAGCDGGRRVDRLGRAAGRSTSCPRPPGGDFVIAEIQCLPSPAGTDDTRYAHVDAAIAAIRASGLRTEVGPLGTSIEGPPDAVWAAVRAAHEACLRSGAASAVSIIKVAEGATGGPDSGPGIDDLVGPHCA